MTFSKKVLQFNDKFLSRTIDLPTGYKVINPFIGDQKKQVKKVTTAFYQKYYNDTNIRRLILGSSPSRRGSAVTGVPFEDAKHLQNETGIFIEDFYVNRSSSGFLYDVMREYGGCEKFYTDFYMNFVCPLGIVLFCTLDDAPLVRLNDGVSAWIERSYANYLRLFEQFN